MWSEFEARIAENEGEQPLPLRRALLEVIRGSNLHPGQGVTKKMVSFEFGPSERLLWEIQSPARNFFLSQKWQFRLESAGFSFELRPYQKGVKDGGRHSALSREWAFGEGDCVALRIDDTGDLKRLLELIVKAGAELVLDPAAVERWIASLKKFFPNLDRFDTPDPDFDDRERDYKLKTVANLRAALAGAADDQAVAQAILAAASDSNLLDWRTYLPLTRGSDADRSQLDPALGALAQAALGPTDGHPAALAAFASAWRDAVPKGSDDAARQIGEFLFLHLWPDEGVYIRHSVRQDLWREAIGTRFPRHETMADTYLDELRFMRAVRKAFEQSGLAPRDMIDVQSALWVVHNYKDDGDATLDELFNRDTVEAAMDAFDSYRVSGEHGYIFNAFEEPRDYWVRSTRERQNRVYPTKPLVGYILNKTDLSGGWGQKADAAARMHNAGFIVVDRDDKPATPPEKAEHLLRDADRIRVCALNYFIEPARERGASSVAIRAGDLAQAMGLRDAFPNICQALGGDKFQQLAKVPAPTSTEPNPSSSTTFTYQLGSKAEPNTVTEATSTKAFSATNLILYGPPGTGKTYATAWEAVRLCLGNDAAAELKNNRDVLMAEYRRLVNDGRIEFTTFHQSFSYEEFVEGLRPSTGEGETNTPEEIRSGGGFVLKPHDGIFKRISERARLDQGDDDHARHLDRSQGLFKLSLIGSDWRDQLASAMKQHQISWGFGAGIDWSAPEFEDFQAIKQLWLESNPGTDGRSADISGTWYFRGAADVGSYVLLTVGKNRIVALGRISGDYEFHPHAGDRQHTRKVDWIWGDERGADRSSFYPQTFSAFQPMYQLAPDKIDWDTLEAITFGKKAQSTTPPGREGTELPFLDGSGSSNEQAFSDDGGYLVPLVDLDKLDLDEEPEGELFTIGKLPPVRAGTFRHLAQDVAKQLVKRYPHGFALNQYRDALVKAGKMAAIEPTGGWESHNMPNWASHPAQGWLVPKAQVSATSRPDGGMPIDNVSAENRASNGPEKSSNQYVLIIDEINRANISKVFGELITLLEQDKRLGAQNEVRVQLPYSKKPFGVPSNLHIIGTMNTADRSIALLDTALRRRFSFQELMPDPKVLSENVGGINLRKLLFTINERIEYLFDREHQIGHAYFTGCRRRSDVEDVMRHKVIPLLAEYFYDDWSKVAAVLGDGPATTRKHFLEAISLPPPKGMSEDDLNGDKLRWSVKAEFDFSEFEA